MKSQNISYAMETELVNSRTRAIITLGLYVFYPIFEVNFFVFKEVFFRKFCPYVWLVFKSGLWWRAAYSIYKFLICTYVVF